MTAAYVYHLDAASPHVQSGRPHSILLSFKKLGLEVEEMFPLAEEGVWPRKLRKIGNLLRYRQYLLDRDSRLLRGFARQLHERLRRTEADFIFSPSTLPLSYLETDLPVSFCADAPFCAMKNYYSSFTRLTARQIDLSEELEARVLKSAALAVYPTQWAADLATAHYGVPRGKLAVIPFGANFGRTNRHEDVERWIEQRASERPLKLLFVGREWERKGGPVVVETAEWIRKQGIELRVDFVGCPRPMKMRNHPHFVFHGNLSPQNPLQAAQLFNLYREAHFLFVPSKAEAYGMVFCEANAFGVPAVSNATGGITGIINHGSTGFVFPQEVDASTFGRAIIETFDSRHRYEKMARAASAEFQGRLNWDSFCRTFLECARKTIPAPSDARPDFHRPDQPCSAIDIRSSNDSDDLFSACAPDGQPPMRVAFVATDYFDPKNISSWSGLPYFMWRALERQGLQLKLVRVDDSGGALRYWRFLLCKLMGKRYLRDRDPMLLKSYAKQIQRGLQGLDVEFIFCPGTAPISFLQTDIPIAFWVDACFAGMKDYYNSFSTLSLRSVAEAHASDQAALERAALAIYSSQWAADSARAAYRVDPKRLHVIRFGANLENPPAEGDIGALIRARTRDYCRLLWIGVDWKRKRADLAVSVARELEKVGIPTQLTLIGCKAPRSVKLPDFVEVVGFVSKASEQGRRCIEDHFRKSHFFFMPTQAEAYGLVFCEANAFALPCVATGTGGVASIIHDGFNGCLLPSDASPFDYAQRIAEIWRNPAQYEAHSLNSYQMYRQYLNWDVSAKEVVALMRRSIEQHRSLTEGVAP